MMCKLTDRDRATESRTGIRLFLIALGVAGLAACGTGGGGGGGDGSGGRTNSIPIVDATSVPSTAQEGERVDLIGSASDPDEPDDVIVATGWSQISGQPTVTITFTSQNNATFIAPNVQTATTLIFRFEATDNFGATGFADVAVNIEPPPSTGPPVVDAGLDQTASSGDTVTLNGSATDPDGSSDIVSQQWRQIDTGNGAPTVALSSSSGGSIATFTAPQVTAATTLTFEFTATDRADPPNVVSDRMTVSVQPLPRRAGPSNLYVTGAFGATEKYVDTEGNLNYSRENSFVFVSEGDRGTALDSNGALYQVDDANDRMVVSCAIERRGANSGNGGSDFDRTIVQDGNDDGGPELDTPNGMLLIPEEGLMVVADTGSSSIKVFDSHDTGDTVPVVTPFNPAAAPYDVAYDRINDSLYISLVNGRVAVYDDFVTEVRAGLIQGLDRLLSIVDSSGNNIGDNLTGIVYEPISDRLIVTDQRETLSAAQGGSDNFDTDGAVYVLSGVSQQNGNVLAQVLITGPATGLGNPVDVVLNGRDVIVADNVNGRVLIFVNALQGPGGNIAPTRSFETISPFALTLQPLDTPARPGVTDLGFPPPSLTSIVIGAPDNDGNNQLVFVDPSLNTVQRTFALGDAGERPVGVVADTVGNMYVVQEDPGMTIDNFRARDHVVAYDRLALAASGRAGGSIDGRDRDFGTGVAIRDATAMEIIPELGLLLVADRGDDNPLGETPGGISVFSLCGTGARLAFLQTASRSNDPSVDTSDDFQVNDLDYDPSRGDLYAATTDGEVAVWRGFQTFLQILVLTGDADPPERSFVITPVDGNNVSFPQLTSTAFSVEYIPGLDWLVIGGQDVPPIGGNAQGGLFIIEEASRAVPTQVVDTVISGPNTMLDQPIDMSFDGADLYVVDFGTGQVLLFRSLSITPGGNITPGASIGATGALSVQVLPVYLGAFPEERQ